MEMMRIEELMSECDEIDFLCAPVSYASDRRLGRDHACLLPCDSLRAHGKLLFAENDTRTHLTRIPFPELPYFQNPVFRPRRYEDAVEMLKLHFCRAFLHGYAHWWFDMWGGCFNDPIYMSEMREFLEISKGAINKPMGSVSEIAVFIDEKCYKYCKNNHNGMSLAYHFRDVLRRPRGRRRRRNQSDSSSAGARAYGQHPSHHSADRRGSSPH